MDNSNSSASQITLTVKFFAGLRQLANLPQRELHLPSNSTIDDVLELITKINPKLGSRINHGVDSGYINVLLNGRNIRFLDRYDTAISDMDTVAFLPPVGGG